MTKGVNTQEELETLVEAWKFDAGRQTGFLRKAERDLQTAKSALSQALDALEMVRDADIDCELDGLAAMPAIARATVERAIETIKDALTVEEEHV